MPFCNFCLNDSLTRFADFASLLRKFECEIISSFHHFQRMLLFSSVKLFALGAFIGLAFIGAFFFYSSRRGFMRNGYFTLPAVILIVFVLFIAFQTIGYLITVLTIGTKIEDNTTLALCINGVAELSVLLLGSILIARLAKQDPFAVFRLEGFNETPAMAYVLAVPLILTAQVAGEALSAIWIRFWKFFPDIFQSLDQYESASDKAQQGLVTAHGVLEFFIVFLFVAIVPAISEEALFRGFAQSNIERSGHHHARPWIALFSASLLFAAVHASLFKLPGLFMLGITLAWLAYRTSNLFVGALAHATNNGVIVLALYLYPDATQSTSSNLVSVDQLSATDALLMLVPVLPVLVGLAYLFHRITNPLQARHNAELEVQAWNADSIHVEFEEPHEPPEDTL